jgi:cell division protein FtsN
MMNDDSESGLEMVLDNRKLIIGFVLLITVVGCSFVIGFIEGKRQGLQEADQAAAEATLKAAVGESQAPARSSADAEASKPATYKAEEQHLDWYKSVNRKEGEPEKTLQAPTPSPEAAKPKPLPSSAPAEKPKPEIAPAHSGPVTYSVQVGAFRQKRELDARAQMLRSKGFEYRIESPKGPEDLYLLKVGPFHSRAEAVAMQLRLKQSGIPCFIKTN